MARARAYNVIYSTKFRESPERNTLLVVEDHTDQPFRAPLSLSTYYPKDTQYFYGYPAGNDSGFLNNVPPEIEELVSMRAISCAGPSVCVICYAATDAPDIDRELWRRLNLPVIEGERLLKLPAEITPRLQGSARNEAIKQALKSVAQDHSLVMAQPYLSRRLETAYQIPADITAWINDKNNLQKLISKEYAPKRLATFMDGGAFNRQHKKIELPVVVKVTCSSSGDGVYICQSPADITAAAKATKNLKTPILVEQYVEEVRNFGLHFGIPYDTNRPIDIIGINEQLTSEAGQFEGGIIHSADLPAELEQVGRYMEEVCLPRVRRMGWYGIGCFDVLIDKSGSCYIVDSNFRMTGMSAYHFMAANGELKPPLIGFSGSYEGTRQELETALLPFIESAGRRGVLRLIALNEHDGIWRFNAALMFDNERELVRRCRDLTAAGISSDLLARYS